MRACINVAGQRVTVTCPLDARPFQKIRFKLPIVPTNEQVRFLSDKSKDCAPNRLFQPPYRAGHASRLQEDALLGSPWCKRFLQTMSLSHFPPWITYEQVQSYKLRYNKDGWIRSLGTDIKFHWARHEMNREVRPSPAPCSVGFT
jgi:hypothetical protein